MEVRYSFDIYEKIVQIFGLLYFAWGLMTCYVFSCKELDFKSDHNRILVFWEPVAGITGLLNMANLMFIIFFALHRKQILFFEKNLDINPLFYILSIPVFIITIIYLSLGIVLDSYNTATNGHFTLFMTISELLLFICSMFLIIHIDFFKQRLTDKFVKKCVVLITTIGLVNYFFFHLSAMHIHIFIELASESDVYSQFYNKSTQPVLYDPAGFLTWKNNLQPFVILYCFLCIVYLIFQRNSQFNQYSSELNSIPSTQESLNRSISVLAMNPTNFRLPLPFFMGILFFTITLLVLAVSNSLINSSSFYSLGTLIFTVFPIPAYIFSIFLLLVQIKEMEKWKKLSKSENLIDKVLMWIGTGGQILVAFGKIKYTCFNIEDYISAMVILEYILLVFQSIFQSVMIGLALERKWVFTEGSSWRSHICPPVGLLSINLAFLIFSVYIVQTDAVTNIHGSNKESFLFVRLYGIGFVSFGQTLAILHRLHSSLIFGKMIISTYY